MKKIVFITGTRADYGKMKSLIIEMQKNKQYEVSVFVTGMHNLKKFGSTYKEIYKDEIKNIYKFKNQKLHDNMDRILSKTINGFSNFTKLKKLDLIIFHGDRIESLACAIVGCLNNIKTAHIEGGEVSGTVDEILRHSISKLSHTHFVTNNKAKKRLRQMGEKKNNIFVIGSPDVDIIKSKTLPKIDTVKKKYDINFDDYAIGIYHPITTDLQNLKTQCKIYIKSILDSKKNFVLIYPNNDIGNTIILNEYLKLKNNRRIRLIPSMRFEYYLTLLKHAKFIIGNSSSGIMEAPYYGTFTINIGNRQNKRASLKSITNCKFSTSIIKSLINKAFKKKRHKKIEYFGSGDSFKSFGKILKTNKLWKIDNQKEFQEIKF
ncbi:UDP-N-acetylglucosamine 2-epimerase [Candidatus Pelagibacter ubique]|nr:UDP-N-acetylglucosamine 2-epimerase [Candidatus Pelagibacter ubique]